MSDKWKVSVVIPVYNAALYVNQAVESALAQPEVNEILLVEDSSQDGSLEVCKQLVNIHPNVTLLQHSGGVNRGAGPSRNLGMRESTQPFISFLDADDIYLPGRFSRASEVFRIEPDCLGVYEAIGALFEDDAGRARWQASDMTGTLVTTMTTNIPPGELFTALTRGTNGHIHMDGLVIRREALSRCGYMEETIKLSLGEDTDFILRLAASCVLLPGSLDSPVALRRVHSQNFVSAPRPPEQNQQLRLEQRFATYRWIRKNGTVEQRRLAFRRLMRQWFAWPEIRNQAAKLRSLISFAWKYPMSILEPDYWIEGKDTLLNYLRKEKIEEL